MLPLLPTLAFVAANLQAAAQDLTELSIEELFEVEVTSVSRKEQAVADSAAAIHVITQEDIRRSGHTAIPELLRMVPGVQVARIDAHSWAVTVRGFQTRFTDKLLVMVDGRTVYTNLFSGVFWDVQEIPLDDIERIEVIRGPGGTMWGANAVNGIINIITKSSEDTQGLLSHVLAGNEDRLISTARYGGAIGERAWWRAWVHGFVRDSFEDPDGGEASDEWSMLRGGFRFDWEAGDRDSFMVSGDVYDGKVDEAFPLLSTEPPFALSIDETFDLQGGHLLGRWTRETSSGSSFRVQSYLDHTSREADILEDDRNTFDVDFQHRFSPWERHELVWGLGYRLIDGRFEGTPALELQPASRDDQLFSGFVQDEIRLRDDLTFTLGTKIEHNDFTGFEVQPTARLLWKPQRVDSVWAAVSRAVRSPAVIAHDLVLPIDMVPGSPPTFVVLFGNDDFESEELVAYEAGVRFRVTDRAFLDVAAFYFDYDDLTTIEPGEPFSSGGATIQPMFFDNRMEGRSVGLEVAADVRPTSWWRSRASVALFDLELETKAGSQDTGAESAEENDPSATASLLTYIDLRDDLELDLGIYAVDELEGLDVDSYVRLDARLAWKPTPTLELEAGIQNAQDPSHVEFAPGFVSSNSAVERSYYLGLTWRP